jgi:hypothetical protein
MATEPRFTFRLPAGWEARPSTAAPVAGVDFAALYAIPDQGFTPNITVAAQHVAPGTDVAQLADQTVAHLRRNHPDLQEVRRAPLGTAAAPGVGQEVRFSVTLADQPVELTQVHVVVAAGPLDAPEGQIVLKTAFTAATRQAPSLIPAFQQFVASLAVMAEEA